MKFVVGEKGKTPRKPTQIVFRPPGNPLEVTETRTRNPAVGGERLTACATSPPDKCISSWKILFRMFIIMYCSFFLIDLYSFDYVVELNLTSYNASMELNKCFLKTVKNDLQRYSRQPFNWFISDSNYIYIYIYKTLLLKHVMNRHL